MAQSIDSVTFREQADWWIKAIEDGRVLHRRKRTKMKPATVCGIQVRSRVADSFTSAICPWQTSKTLLPRSLVAKMKESGLADKSTVSYFQVVQSVVASAVNDEGERIHPRKWTRISSAYPWSTKETESAYPHSARSGANHLPMRKVRAMFFWRCLLEAAFASERLWL